MRISPPLAPCSACATLAAAAHATTTPATAVALAFAAFAAFATAALAALAPSNLLTPRPAPCTLHDTPSSRRTVPVEVALKNLRIEVPANQEEEPRSTVNGSPSSLGLITAVEAYAQPPIPQNAAPAGWAICDGVVTS